MPNTKPNRPGTPLLFQPYTVRGVTFSNRVVLPPMVHYRSKNGICGTFHTVHLGKYILGGFGLVFTEAAAVEPRGMITEMDLAIFNDEQAESYKPLIALAREEGAALGIQLAHGGRKAGMQSAMEGNGPLSEAEVAKGRKRWTPVGPTTSPISPEWPTPHQLSRAEIQDLVQKYADAARRSARVGFDVVEIHGAHGYLIGEFLSPHSNRRTDAYGGSFENRTRLALEVVDAVRAVWPEELPLFFRISATDWLTENTDDERDGWSAEDTVRFARELRAHGVDLLDVSTGGLAPRTRIPVGPGYQVPFAERVRTETGLPVAAVGLITDPVQAEKILSDKQADAVLIGRELLRDPYFARHASRDLDGDVPTPEQYGWAV